MSSNDLYVVNTNGLLSGRLGKEGSLVTEWQVRQACEWYNDRALGELYEPIFSERGVDLAIIDPETNDDTGETLKEVASPFDVFKSANVEVLRKTSDGTPVALEGMVKGVSFYTDIVEQNGSYTALIYKRKKLLPTGGGYGRQVWFETLKEASDYMLREFESTLFISFDGSIY